MTGEKDNTGYEEKSMRMVKGFAKTALEMTQHDNIDVRMYGFRLHEILEDTFGKRVVRDILMFLTPDD